MLLFKTLTGRLILSGTLASCPSSPPSWNRGWHDWYKHCLGIADFESTWVTTLAHSGNKQMVFHRDLCRL